MREQIKSHCDDVDGCGDRLKTAEENEPSLKRTFHRVMRAVMFDEPPHPELDSLPLAQLRLLWTVFFGANATMKDFSERLGVSQSTVTQLADRLVRRGLIERRPDPADRRVVRLHVSESGAQILEAADGRQRDTFAVLWRLLSDENRGVVMQGLEILAEAAERMRREQGRQLPPLLEYSEAQDNLSETGAETSQPVVDLMARRVRGRNAT